MKVLVVLIVQVIEDLVRSPGVSARINELQVWLLDVELIDCKQRDSSWMPLQRVSDLLRHASLLVRRLFQIQESPTSGLTLTNVSLLQNLERSVDANKELGLVIIFQACFPNMVVFIVSIFLIPTPPSDLAWQIEFQTLRWSFLSPTSCPHQKFLVNWLSFLHT